MCGQRAQFFIIHIVIVPCVKAEYGTSFFVHESGVFEDILREKIGYVHTSLIVDSCLHSTPTAPTERVASFPRGRRGNQCIGMGKSVHSFTPVIVEPYHKKCRADFCPCYFSMRKGIARGRLIGISRQAFEIVDCSGRQSMHDNSAFPCVVFYRTGYQSFTRLGGIDGCGFVR